MYPKPILRTVLIFLLLISWTTGESFQADDAQSSVKFKIKCLMVGNVTGTFNHFSGHFDLVNGKLKSFNAKLYTNSINTGNSKRDKDLKSANFFNTKYYPEMRLKMIGVKKDTVLIKLTIKGITKQIVFDYKPSKKIIKFKKNHRTGFSLSGQLYLKDFNLNLRSAVGAGSIVLGKTVKIIAEIEGVKNSILADNSLAIH